MRYRLSRQEKVHYCAPAMTQAILREHEIYLNQSQIAQAVGCTEKDGTYINDLGNFLLKQGFNFEFFDYNKVPLNEPDSLLKENIGKKHIFLLYPNSEKNHFVLVTGFSDPIITIIDSHDLTKKQVNLACLTRRMSEKSSGGFGLVEKL